MKNKIAALAISSAMVLGVLSGCGGNSAETAESSVSAAAESSGSAVSEEETAAESSEEAEEEETAETETRTVTDAAGNTVEVPADISRIAVTPLPWSSVIYAIDGTAEHMVSINPGAISAYTGNFLETMSPEYGSIDATAIGKDFSINMEEMVNMDVQAVVIWDYQEDEAEQLKELGIAPVMVKNDTVEDLQASFRAIGELVGEEERAQEFIDLYEDTYTEIQSYNDQVEEAEKPRVLYLRTSELKLQGNDNFMKEALELAGADNVAAESSELTMEEIIDLDPEIIFLSWFDPFTPEDLYNNTIDGQDWSNVTAVKEKRVYKTPIGIYRWDAPGVETPLMMQWLATMIQPEIFSDIDIREEVSEYFKHYFDIDLTEEDLAQIMSDAYNAESAE
ncbi:MAG: ABC transporter substrate-binding protein [Lachnospiraceae bacterium]|nr:ABC transporter substrate-binding protein [Lachnospiraceae bacterium]